MGWTWVPKFIKVQEIKVKDNSDCKNTENEIHNLKSKVERLERVLNSILIVEDSNQVRYSSNLETVRECQNILSGATPRAYTQIKASLEKESAFIKYDTLQVELKQIEQNYPDFKR